MLNLDIFPSEIRWGCLVCGLCNLYLQQFSFLYIETLHNDCLYFEDVHLLFCIHLIDLFPCLEVLNLDIFFLSNARRGSGFV